LSLLKKSIFLFTFLTLTTMPYWNAWFIWSLQPAGTCNYKVEVLPAVQIILWQYFWLSLSVTVFFYFWMHLSDPLGAYSAPQWLFKLHLVKPLLGYGNLSSLMLSFSGGSISVILALPIHICWIDRINHTMFSQCSNYDCALTVAHVLRECYHYYQSEIVWHFFFTGIIWHGQYPEYSWFN